MEPIRPQVDAYVLDWLARSSLKREWFFEERNGNCRLMASLTSQLSESLATWRGAVAPIAEWVARALWQTIKKSPREPAPPTRLTQRHKRESKSAESLPAQSRATRPENLCRRCGVRVSKRQSYCASCWLAASSEHMTNIAKEGRIASLAPEVQDRRSKKASTHLLARWEWSDSKQPSWLTKEFYETKIQPLLVNYSRSAIVATLNVAKPYAGLIRLGKRLPHPRHWQKLAKLTGVSADQ